MQAIWREITRSHHYPIMGKLSKRHRDNQQKITQGTHTIDEAIKLIKEMASAKFDESVEAHFNLGLDPKKPEHVIRHTIEMPNGTGRTLKIAVFTESKQAEAKNGGADIVGGKNLVDEIAAKKQINFDVAVATPDFMRELSRVAKILGPKGLMPSPKTGTISDDVLKIIGKLKKGQITIKSDASSNLHQIIGKVSFDAQKIRDNFTFLLSEIKKVRPKGIKGAYIRNVTLCATMGPGIKVDF